jgi:hypothetical protein
MVQYSFRKAKELGCLTDSDKDRLLTFMLLSLDQIKVRSTLSLQNRSKSNVITLDSVRPSR